MDAAASFFRDMRFPDDFHRASQPLSGAGDVEQVIGPHPWLPGGNADGKVNNYVVDPTSADFNNPCRLYSHVVGTVVELYPNPTGNLKRNLIKNLHYWYTGVNGGCSELFPYGHL
jgi:hypothetical protein